MCPVTKSPPPPVAARPWVILLTDPRELGAALKAVAKRGLSTTYRADRVRRFKTKGDARKWLREKVPAGHRIRARYRPRVEKL